MEKNRSFLLPLVIMSFLFQDDFSLVLKTDSCLQRNMRFPQCFYIIDQIGFMLVLQYTYQLSDPIGNMFKQVIQFLHRNFFFNVDRKVDN